MGAANPSPAPARISGHESDRDLRHGSRAGRWRGRRPQCLRGLEQQLERQLGASKPAAAADTVSLKSVSGVGSVLVDSKGFALYSPTQEQTGTIHCTGSCTAVWIPLHALAGCGQPDCVVQPDVEAWHDHAPRRQEAGHLRRQAALPFRSRRFSGEGHGRRGTCADHFGSRSFTWHVVSSGKTRSHDHTDDDSRLLAPPRPHT